MKIIFVSVESGITALGFRKVAAIARSLNSETDICFIPVDNLYSFISHIFPNKKTGIWVGKVAQLARARQEEDVFRSNEDGVAWIRKNIREEDLDPDQAEDLIKVDELFAICHAQAIANIDFFKNLFL